MQSVPGLPFTYALRDFGTIPQFEGVRASAGARAAACGPRRFGLRPGPGEVLIAGGDKFVLRDLLPRGFTLSERKKKPRPI